MIQRYLKSLALAIFIGQADYEVNAGTVRVKPLTETYGDNGDDVAFEDLTVTLTTSSVSVGGFSSGGEVSSELLAMFNSKLSGGAMIAGAGPCATAAIKYKVLNQCRNPKVFDTAGLTNMPIYIMGGTQDDVVLEETVREMAAWFTDQGVNLVQEYPDYGHTMPNDLPVTANNPTTDCLEGGYENCGDDMSGKYMAHLLQTTLAAWKTDYNTYGQFYAFDQTPYAIGFWARMWKEGYIYIPDNCVSASCPLHVYFHGCFGTAKLQGTDDIRKSGHLEHAAANDYVVIFPQTDDYFQMFDGKHCWRITDTPEHKQTQALRRILRAFYGGVELLTDDYDLPRPDSAFNAFNGIGALLSMALLSINLF